MNPAPLPIPSGLNVDRLRLFLLKTREAYLRHVDWSVQRALCEAMADLDGGSAYLRAANQAWQAETGRLPGDWRGTSHEGLAVLDRVLARLPEAVPVTVASKGARR